MSDTLDVLTLAEAKTALNLDGSTHDTELAQWITAVSRRLDELCGAVVIRTVTEEKHDGGVPWVRLRKAPCSASSATTVTSVVEYDDTTSTTLTAESNASKPDDAYLFDQRLGVLRRRDSNADGTFAVGRQNVVVTYEGGRYAATASVGTTFKLTAGAILRRLWQREQGAWATGGDLFAEPGVGVGGFFKAVSETMVREFLSDELRPPTAA